MKPTASVRPMAVQQSNQRETVRRWIPAEVWQKQGMSAQEMTLPLGKTLGLVNCLHINVLNSET